MPISNQVWALERPWPLSSRALKGEKRHALHQKHRASRKAEVGDLDIAATPLSRVGKSRAPGLQAGEKRGQKLHRNHEIKLLRFANLEYSALLELLPI